MFHQGLPGLDHPKALGARPEAIVGIDVIDEKFLAERTDLGVHRQRDQGAGRDHRLDFFPRALVGRHTEEHARARITRWPVHVAKPCSDHRQSFPLRVAGVYREQRLEQPGVDAAVLIEQEHPRESLSLGALDTDVQRARHAEILPIQYQGYCGEFPQHSHRGSVGAVIHDHQRADLRCDASYTIGKSIVRVVRHHDGAYLYRVHGRPGWLSRSSW